MNNFERATLGLNHDHGARLPSQFMCLPRACSRLSADFSTLGYARAMSVDLLDLTGCLDAKRLEVHTAPKDYAAPRRSP